MIRFIVTWDIEIILIMTLVQMFCSSKSSTMSVFDVAGRRSTMVDIGQGG